MENNDINLPTSQPSPVESKSMQGAKLPGPTVIFKQAWGIFKSRFWVLIFISLLPIALMLGYFIVVIGGFSATSFLFLALKLSAGFSSATALAGIILAVLVYLAVLFITFWSQTALIFAIKGAGENISFKESFKQSSHKIGSFFGAAVVAGLASTGVIILYVAATVVFSLIYGVAIPVYLGYFIGLLCIISTAYLSVRFCLSTFIVVGDNAKALPAARRSFDYTRGYWWPIFWRLLFIGMCLIILWLAVLLLIILFSTFLKGAAALFSTLILLLVEIVLYALFPPVFAAYCYQLYANLKSIKGESEIPSDKSSKFLIIIMSLILIAFVVGIFYLMFALPGIYMKRAMQTQYQQPSNFSNYTTPIPQSTNTQTDNTVSNNTSPSGYKFINPNLPVAILGQSYKGSVDFTPCASYYGQTTSQGLAPGLSLGGPTSLANITGQPDPTDTCRLFIVGTPTQSGNFTFQITLNANTPAATTEGFGFEVQGN